MEMGVNLAKQIYNGISIAVNKNFFLYINSLQGFTEKEKARDIPLLLFIRLRLIKLIAFEFRLEVIQID
jgi:hypothetical protein